MDVGTALRIQDLGSLPGRTTQATYNPIQYYPWDPNVKQGQALVSGRPPPAYNTYVDYADLTNKVNPGSQGNVQDGSLSQGERDASATGYRAGDYPNVAYVPPPPNDPTADAHYEGGPPIDLQATIVGPILVPIGANIDASA
ncbi:MAG: hypothetical protein ACYDA5_08170 [Vulcanimicrobiaceae bacterium]